jgi:hypothetical protein
MAAYNQNVKASYPGFGKPSASSFGPATPPSGDTQYAGGTPNWRNVGQPAGQAQSTPQPSQGTKYGAYAPPTSQSTGDPRGAYATAAPSQRPPPFQVSAAQTPWGQSMDPFAERDAFVNQINQQRMQRQVDFNSGGMPPAGSDFRINYQQAAQQAGLGGGAPSMQPNYGDSMIGRLNQSFGGQGNPFAYQQPYAPPQQGYQNQGSAQPIAQPAAGYPGFDPRTQAPSGQPLRPGNAQPIAQPPQGSPYNPGGAPPMPVGFEDVGGGAGLAVMTDYYNPSTGQTFRSPSSNIVPGQGSGWVRGAPQQQAPQNAYSPISTVGPPPMPPTGPANPYGTPVIDRPAPPPAANVAELQKQFKYIQERVQGEPDRNMQTALRQRRADIKKELASLGQPTAPTAAATGAAGSIPPPERGLQYARNTSPPRPPQYGSPDRQVNQSPAPRPWWEGPGADRTNFGNQYIPGYSWQGSQLWPMDVLNAGGRPLGPQPARR